MGAHSHHPSDLESHKYTISLDTLVKPCLKKDKNKQTNKNAPKYKKRLLLQNILGNILGSAICTGLYHTTNM